MAKRQKGLQMRQRIVAAADRLFYQCGYNRTSFSDIADAAEIPRGNFYYHFKSKDEILEAVIDARMAAIGAMLDQWQCDIAAPRDRLERFVQILLNEEPNVLRYGCPIGSLNMELAKNQVELQSHAAQMFNLFLDWLRQQFAALGTGDEGHSLALQLLAETQGIAIISNVYQDAAFLEREAQRLTQWLGGL